MKLQDVILKAMAKKLTWIQAAEIAGMSVRNMQRMRQRYQEGGYTGLFDHRRGKRSIHRVPMEKAEKVLALYRDRYADFNVRHFHEKLKEMEGIQLSYSWVKQALQGAIHPLDAAFRVHGEHAGGNAFENHFHVMAAIFQFLSCGVQPVGHVVE